MNDNQDMLKELISGVGKSGSETTHSLKIIGGGDMGKGLEKLVEYGQESGRQIGLSMTPRKRGRK